MCAIIEMKMRMISAASESEGLRIDSMVKPLSAAELAVLAAGRPASRPDDFFGWRKESNRYDRLVVRQKKLAAAAEPLQPRRSERLEMKKLFVSKEWLHMELPQIEEVEAGTPERTDDERRVARRLSARITTPGGSELVEEEMVSYTLPLPDESGSAQKRRFDRARR